MKTADRTLVYFGGFVLGMLLVSMILSRRAARDEARTDPWLAHNAAMMEAGAEPLPEQVHPSIHEGLIIDFGYLPNEEMAQERVWLLRFDQSYPNVRVVEDVTDGTIAYMAADQIKLTMREGIDVTKLQPMLDALGIRLRMFNRKERIAVVGVLNTSLTAIPDTIESLKPWADLFERSEPDWILFKGE